jgi:ubiquinone/menaquinone biosynthesis C-methylase UbiE
MKQLLRKLLGHTPNIPSSANVHAAEMPKAESSAQPERAARDIGLDGWHHPKTGELIPGFPVSAEDTVLDVGCGDADHSRYCLERGAKVTFTDINPQVVEAVQQRFDALHAGKATGIVSDSYPLPIESESMSRIIVTEVLEHVDDVQEFMKELYRVGKPGALYFITVPDAVSEKLQQGIAPPSYFEKPNHIRIISDVEFASIVTEAGLTIESQQPYGAYWTLWWMFFWNSGVDLSNPDHPLLKAWAATWNELLKTSNPYKTIKALDKQLPKSQVVLARKV